MLMEEIKRAVEEMKLIRAGKKKARNADDFINELLILSKQECPNRHYY